MPGDAAMDSFREKIVSGTETTGFEFNEDHKTNCRITTPEIIFLYTYTCHFNFASLLSLNSFI